MKTSLTAWIVVLCLLPGGCRGGGPPETPRVPEIAVPEIAGPEAGWPPRPKGVTRFTPVPSREIPGSLTDELEAQIRQASQNDPRVRSLLGSRFAYIMTDEVDGPKESPRRPGEPLVTRVTFYSHANNVAVKVLMRGTEVMEAAQAAGYQPPEGREELEEAIALARRDERLRGQVEGLQGDAMLTWLERGQPGSGNRVLFVCFSKENDDRPAYTALVDLTTQQVLAAGPADGRR
ncbi:MAG: hypothetical protein ABUT39_21735 [Acidobacteriota bacterium]